ncbi:MAG: hypothetical protein ACI3VA_11645 [Candidatus Limivicinus sp.]
MGKTHFFAPKETGFRSQRKAWGRGFRFPRPQTPTLETTKEGVYPPLLIHPQLRRKSEQITSFFTAYYPEK